ncbi:hypothetical protein GNT65_19335 [Shewanella sp. JBTF-M18]|uniref:Uncharacterized protein n=1 Tax=Shewanella insulae TaxID=2681496 RepID=A0A6L7I350_9GAMM|nr:hypothetical protein [Shewanella insulae]MXR70813.1 hypothetical protein [Shewanella insulae]
MNFIYGELYAIDEQVTKLKQFEPSPFEFFTASPYEEEQMDVTLLHKLYKQNLVTQTLAKLHKGMSETHKLSYMIEDIMREDLHDTNVVFMYNLMLLYKLIGVVVN